MDNSRFRRKYAAGRFWNKLASHAKTIGRETIEKALYLYYAAQSPDTPAWARRTIYGALGYFIFPFDAVPDLLPVLGYTDDMSVMAAALATVAFCITPDIKEQARQKLAQWFDKTPQAGNPVMER
ncbi:MAG TPA: YkvA family protein [Paralcaligenes sp.]|jgi:uncharacterized membrane protein YkvA (DUF1232 family)